MADQKAPAGLGDGSEQPEFRLSHESHPLPPGGRKPIIAAIERILSGGGVQKLVVQLGKPILVQRLVRTDFSDNVPDEVIDDDLVNAARNAEMAELKVPDGASAFEVLFHAFSKMTDERLKAKAVLIRRKPSLMKWIDKNPKSQLTELFGVDVVEHKEMPDDVLLLLASKYDDPETVAKSYRIEMYVPSEPKKKLQRKEKA